MPLNNGIIVPGNNSLYKPTASALLNKDDQDETSCLRS